VTTDPAALPELSAPAQDDPRRVVMADMVARLASGLSERAAAYESAAARADGALRSALEGLHRAKEAELEALGPLARALGIATPAWPGLSETPNHWGAILGEAFQAERILDRVTRELAAGAVEPPTRALMARLAADIARDREGVRRLYLQYT
jgi:hypothetical protein